MNRDIVGALDQAIASVTSARSLDETLLAILDACSEGLGYDYLSLVILEPQADRMVGRMLLAGHTGELLRRRGIELPPADVSDSLNTAENLVVRVFAERCPRTTTSYHDLVRPHLPADVAAELQASLGIAAIAVLPLLSSGRCLGVIVAASAQPFAEKDLRELKLFGGQATVAIEYARLHQELRDRERQVSLLLKATIEAQEDERERICLEIHDGVAQALTPAFHYLQALDGNPELPDTLRPNVRKSAMLVRTAVREARDVVATLRPAALDTLGLVPTLRDEIAELGVQLGWRVSFQADSVQFPKTIEIAIYRIVREAVTNIAKHAAATQVAVRVRKEHDHVVVEVQDNGVGVDLPALERKPPPKGVGLLSMRKRAELIGGDFTLTSSPEQGTCVRVEVPVPVV